MEKLETDAEQIMSEYYRIIKCKSQSESSMQIQPMQWKQNVDFLILKVYLFMFCSITKSVIIHCRKLYCDLYQSFWVTLNVWKQWEWFWSFKCDHNSKKFVECASDTELVRCTSLLACSTYPSTLCRCSRLTSAPIRVSSSRGSPIRMALVLLTTSSRNRARIDLCTNTRVPLLHTCV